MKTTGFFFTLLAAAGILTACSNNEAVQPTNEGQEISFRLQGGTPAMRTTATTIASIDAFVVYGTDNVFAANSDLIFDGVTVSRNLSSGTPNTFTYAPKRYYGTGATNAGFFAFSPASAKIDNVDITTFTTGASFDYTVPVPDASGNITQEDLLVASSGLVVPSATPVSLDFTHALSRIFVTATNSTDDPVIITGLTLKNLITTGTLNVDPASAWSWTPSAAIDDYAYVLAPTGVAVPATTGIKTLVTSMEQGMMVLPQETVNTNDDEIFDLNDFALQVNYTFANLGSQTEYVLIKDAFEFEANNQYQININFTGLAIEFEIDVLPFDAPVEVTYP